MKTKRNATVCSPTYRLSKEKAKAADWIGMILFIIFILALMLLFMGLGIIYSKAMVTWMKQLLMAGFAAGIFFTLVAMFSCDILSSIDESLRDIKTLEEQQEKHLYAIATVLTRKKEGKS